MQGEATWRGDVTNPGKAQRELSLPEEERLEIAAAEARAADLAYESLLARLSHQSVVKHFDAYADVAWDAPEMAVDAADPRWELGPDDPLGATSWYRNQPPEIRSAIGLHMIATFAKIGLQFERVLKRGLLDFADTLPDRAPEFRYVYHEIIEEAQHSLMFQEFVNRSGFAIDGLPTWQKLGSRAVVRLARYFPELFFFFVLGGEDPIDHVQRVMLRQRDAMHPLLRRISQIHVTEEARHLSFARAYLRRNIPRLPAWRRRLLRLRVPLLLGQMAKLMLQPSPQIVERYAIPRAVLAEAYRRGPTAARQRHEALAKVRTLCDELHLITPRSARIWAFFGLVPAGYRPGWAAA